MGKRERDRPAMWVTTTDLPTAPGIYFRLLLIRYFEGIDSERRTIPRREEGLWALWTSRVLCEISNSPGARSWRPQRGQRPHATVPRSMRIPRRLREDDSGSESRCRRHLSLGDMFQSFRCSFSYRLTVLNVDEVSEPNCDGSRMKLTDAFEMLPEPLTIRWRNWLFVWLSHPGPQKSCVDEIVRFRSLTLVHSRSIWNVWHADDGSHNSIGPSAVKLPALPLNLNATSVDDPLKNRNVDRQLST